MMPKPAITTGAPNFQWPWSRPPFDARSKDRFFCRARWDIGRPPCRLAMGILRGPRRKERCVRWSLPRNRPTRIVRSWSMIDGYFLKPGHTGGRSKRAGRAIPPAAGLDGHLNLLARSCCRFAADAATIAR